LNFNSHILTHFLYSAHARLKSLHACFLWFLPSRVTGLGQWPGWASWVEPSPCGLSWA
jgi:hypothetical protein